ncbi:carbonic anhydrase [Desulfosporosinus youngiae]|uniref:Carbonic anhydrase n=1 Tax=Desulfosporosinus youngiae DSM 17734 TaxID=768710 RepID=H5Y026_9FIRM|nr:carbonic anhydrase [Desulfosporosinus youngiae]EHQ91935.1 carbonic anhydrase [Desulfosporosinus youngiae DSM 17734]
MQRLLDGLIKFRQEDYEKHKTLFSKLKRKQEPHTLFIACSDSRVMPEMITKSLPGELFVVRNVANLVPPYRETHQEYVATTSAIEYAVKALKVENIVVCGHSNCGGCAAIYYSEDILNTLPDTKKWLELAENVKKRVMIHLKDENDKYMKEWLTEQINILEQIKHLLTYPYIKEKYLKKELNIYGFYYMIETGEVFIFNYENGAFELSN